MYNNQYYAYGPYVREMHQWEKYVNDILIVAPFFTEIPKAIDLPYSGKSIQPIAVPSFSFTSFSEAVKALIKIPYVFFIILKSMAQADHIHLRCPGNIGLLGCLAQLFFPAKKKTAKYAGNWDPNAKQPLSYRFQKWLLGNRLLTKNMQVMVYGRWKVSTKNVVPFFTATYSETERKRLTKPDQELIKMLFVGTLSANKRPLYAVQLAEELLLRGRKVQLALYGDGAERDRIEQYIHERKLTPHIVVHGNQSAEVVKEAYQSAHFGILASKSEGWPKALAEAMFWGAVPVATPVSCVPDMLQQGKRGILLGMHLQQDADRMEEVWEHKALYHNMSQQAQLWSQQYTLEAFEAKIKGLLDN